MCYEINESIIINYDKNKRNYEIINNLNQFAQFANNNIIDELNKITESNNTISKYNILCDIYSKMNKDEISIIYKVNDKKIRLFSNDFVKNNKNNSKMIIDGKEQELKEFYNFSIFSAKRDTLEVKLKNITKITNMSNIFSECSALSSLPDISKWNTTTVTNISGIFSECSTLSSLPDISKWNTSNVFDFKKIFSNCSSLTSLPDISKWDTSNVIDMSNLFYKCSSLLYLPDISQWNITNVINMKEMFSNCSSLSTLPDISKWNTSNVTNMCEMFYNVHH